MVRPLLAFALLVALAGCKRADGPKLKAAAPPDLGRSGWTTLFDKESGVSLALPAGWRVGVPRAFDPAQTMSSPTETTNDALQQMTAEMAKDETHAEKVRLADMREKEGIVLHCVDGSRTTLGEEPTRVYVKRLPDAGYGTLDAAAAAEKQDAHRSMDVTMVETPVGKAARLKAQGQNRIGDVECHVSYVFLDGPDAYVLRLASTNNPDAILGIEKGVAQTFRVSKGK